MKIQSLSSYRSNLLLLAGACLASVALIHCGGEPGNAGEPRDDSRRSETRAIGNHYSPTGEDDNVARPEHQPIVLRETGINDSPSGEDDLVAARGFVGTAIPRGPQPPGGTKSFGNVEVPTAATDPLCVTCSGLESEGDPSEAPVVNTATP
jgi:hypothetical protein